MARQPNWFCTPLPIIKFLQIVCALVVILFFMDGRQQWSPYTLIFLIAVITVVVNVVLLALHYFDVVRTNNAVPWLSVELAWNSILALSYLIAFGILTYDWWEIRGNRWSHHSATPPRNIGAAGWVNRVLCVAVASLINTVLALMLVQRLRIHKLA
ncbi:unnamed protein product, partial [Mesorhabditis spiculigera]